MFSLSHTKYLLQFMSTIIYIICLSLVTGSGICAEISDICVHQYAVKEGMRKELSFYFYFLESVKSGGISLSFRKNNNSRDKVAFRGTWIS